MSTPKHLFLAMAFAAIVLASVSAFAADDPAKFPVLKTAEHFPVQYYISLPKNWSATGHWPIIMAVDASYGDFYGQVDRFVMARKDAPFIIAVPFLTAGQTVPAADRKEKYHYSPDVWARIDKMGPVAYDLAAFDAVLSEVRTEYHGEEKPFLAGWGLGGGDMVWSLLFTQPERWRAVALSCPNFDAKDAAKVSEWPERGNLPVKVFQGESDFLRSSASLDDQWEKAKQTAEQHGYKISRVLIPDKYHDPFAPDVVNFFNSVLKP